MTALSVVSPVYGAEEGLAELVESITRHASEVTDDFEIVLVEDRSPDGSWERIVQLCEVNPRIRAIRLSRNFGQHRAIAVGLEHATGDRVVVMDCDLQDDPAYIPRLWAAADEGFDVVFTEKEERGHSTSRNIAGRLFKRTIGWLSAAGPQDIEFSPAVGNYSMISRRVVDAMDPRADLNFRYLASIRHVGFDRTIVKIEHHLRPYGTSSYNFSRLVTGAAEEITANSYRLLHLSIAVGFSFVGLAAIALMVLLTLWVTRGFLDGWTSIMCLLLISTGLVLSSTGVLGLYLGRTMEQVRGRAPHGISELREPAQVKSATAASRLLDGRVVERADLQSA